MTDSVAGTTATTGSSVYTTAASRAPKQKFDSDMFMTLLVTQLRSQDPSSPLDTNEMIGQTTQLASMEQLTQLTTTTQASFALQQQIAAASVIGREVTYPDADGISRTGTATAVSFDGEAPTVTVGDTTILLSAITRIADSSTD
jgi:flagellar basal-body rod modification protein FlgD